MMVASETLQHLIEENLYQVIGALGEQRSTSNSVVYDTAWVARLIPDFPGYGFEVTESWLLDAQHDDGSWGGDILHYHDRIVSTITALIALKTLAQGDEYHRRIRAGEHFLWNEIGRLRFDANDTIGFPVLSIALMRSAQEIGLDVPAEISQDTTKLEKKFDLLGRNPQAWRHTSLVFSYEALCTHIPADLKIDFSEDNGSVAASPSATTAAILSERTHVQNSLNYLVPLLHDQNDGGMPFVKPFDVFESAWTLHYLHKSGLIAPDDPRLKPVLDFLWERWSPEKGISFSTYFPVPDLDDTAVTYALLRWAGYPVSADVFHDYELDTHFRCYPGEMDLSLSANIRTLAALQHDRHHPLYERWETKIATLLREHDRRGFYWFDKWHISPYYLTAMFIRALFGIVDDLLPQRINWILKTQRQNGGWGYYHVSTPEETAYCLEALLFWDREVERVDPDIIHAAANYLLTHFDPDNHVSLWLAKSLYTPPTLVRAVLISALKAYERYLQRDF